MSCGKYFSDILKKAYNKKCFFSAIFIALLISSSAKVSGKDLGAIRSGEVKSGIFDLAGDTDIFNFYGYAGDMDIIKQSPQGGTSSAWLELYDPDKLRSIDDFEISNHQLLGMDQNVDSSRFDRRR